MKSFLTLVCLLMVTGCSTPAPALDRDISVSITGEVQTPGMYRLPAGISLSTALQRAGGLTDWAYPKSCKIIHKDGTTVTYDYKKKGDRFRLKDGDRVVIQWMPW